MNELIIVHIRGYEEGRRSYLDIACTTGSNQTACLSKL